MRLSLILATIAVVAVFLGWTFLSRPADIQQRLSPSVHEQRKDISYKIDGGFKHLPKAELVKLENVSAIYELVFPDGDIVEIEMRPSPRSVLEFPESIGEAYDGLVFRARNDDAGAALTLARGLRNCASAFREEEEMNNAIASLRASGTYTQADGMQASVSTEGNAIYKNEQRIRTQFDSCKDLSLKQISEHHHWLKVASTLGDYHATKMIANGTRPGSVKYEAFKNLWNSGDLNALGWIGQAMLKPWPDVKQDLVSSYGYFYVYIELTRISMSDVNGNVSSFFKRIEAATDLEGKRALLTHQEEARAIKFAKTLLAESDACCIGLWGMNPLVSN